MILPIADRRTRILVGVGLSIGLGLICAAIIVTIVLTLTSTSTHNCENVPEPLGLYINKYRSHFTVSWYGSRPPPECGVTYLVDYDVDGVQRGYAYTESNSHMITDLRLDMCSVLTARVSSIDKAGVVNENFVTGDFKETPTYIRITNLLLTKNADGVLVTWDDLIQLAKCDTTYRLTIHTDLGETTIFSNTSSIIIPNDAYCFMIEISVDVVIESVTISTVWQYYYERGNIDSARLGTSPNNPEELLVTWDNHPKEELCSITYTVNYRSQDIADQQSVIVTSPEARFNFTYCIPAAVVIITYGLNETTAGPSDVVMATQYPQVEITNVSVIFEEATALISWEQTPSIETCNFTYVVNVLTDVGDFSENSTETSIELQHEFYCFLVSLEIQPLVREEKIMNRFLFDIEYGLSPVSNLELSAEVSSNTLVATWTNNENQERCGIEYVVTYWDSTFNKTETTSLSSVDFDILYCTTAFVTVEAIGDVTTSEASFATYDTGLPPSIGQVQNIKMVEFLDGFIRVSWDPPVYVNYCNIEYTVTAVDNDKQTCIGFSTCDIGISNYCPSIDFVIVASSLNGEPISAKPVTKQYTC